MKSWEKGSDIDSLQVTDLELGLLVWSWSWRWIEEEMEGGRAPQTIQVIIAALAYIPDIEGKFLLLKTRHT